MDTIFRKSEYVGCNLDVGNLDSDLWTLGASNNYYSLQSNICGAASLIPETKKHINCLHIE